MRFPAIQNYTGMLSAQHFRYPGRRSKSSLDENSQDIEEVDPSILRVFPDVNEMQFDFLLCHTHACCQGLDRWIPREGHSKCFPTSFHPVTSVALPGPMCSPECRTCALGCPRTPLSPSDFPDSPSSKGCCSCVGSIPEVDPAIASSQYRPYCYR